MSNTNVMEKPEVKLLCPISGYCEPCWKDKCALWIDETKECSFKATAKWLGEISITLLDKK